MDAAHCALNEVDRAVLTRLLPPDVVDQLPELVNSTNPVRYLIERPTGWTCEQITSIRDPTIVRAIRLQTGGWDGLPYAIYVWTPHASGWYRAVKVAVPRLFSGLITVLFAYDTLVTRRSPEANCVTYIPLDRKEA